MDRMRITDYLRHHTVTHAARLENFLSRAESLYSRHNPAGHVTASACILSADHAHVLLIRHRALNLWLLPGGHVDDGETAREASAREAREETGLTRLTCLGEDILDIDVHPIPANETKQEAAHWHFDLRYLYVAQQPTDAVDFNPAEVTDYQWVSLASLRTNADTSLQRLARRVQAHLSLAGGEPRVSPAPPIENSMSDSSFDTLLRRFYMKFMPEILNTEDPAAREAIIDQHIRDQGEQSPLEYQAVKFLQEQGCELSAKEIMSRIFGVGENRFYHDEHNLMGIPLRSLESIQSMVRRLADVQIALRGDELRDHDAFYRDELANFNVWAMGVDGEHYQHWIINSVSRDYYWACEEITLDVSNELIPSEISYLLQEDGTVEMLTKIDDPVHQKIDLELSRYCFKRAQHWSEHITAEQKATGVIATQREMKENDFLVATFAFLDPDDARHVRPTHFLRDMAQFRQIDLEPHLQEAIAPYRQRMQDEVRAEYERLYAERRDGTVASIDSQRQPMKVMMTTEALEGLLKKAESEDAQEPDDDDKDT